MLYVEVHEALRKVYTTTLQRPFILALSAGCAAAVCTFWTEVKNIKHEEKARRDQGEQTRDPREDEDDQT